MIGAIPTKCKEEGCNHKTTLGELSDHWVRCDYRNYDCMMCDNKLKGKEVFK